MSEDKKPEVKPIDWKAAAEAIQAFAASPQVKAWGETMKAIAESPKVKEWAAGIQQLQPKLEEWATWAKNAQEILERYKPDEGGIVHIPESELRQLIRRGDD